MITKRYWMDHYIWRNSNFYKKLIANCLKLCTPPLNWMVEIATKTCTRCGEEIDIDMMYFWLDIEFHEHIEDQDIGEPREDKNELLCQTCYTEFSAWFDTDVDTMEEWEEKRSEEVQNIFEV